MLVLLCVQVVQINNNESNWREKKKQLFSVDKQKNTNLQSKQLKKKKKNSNWQDTQANS
jgi:hypothetical protein